MSKHVGKRWRKLCTFSILSSKRRITPTKMTQIYNTRAWCKVHKGKVTYRILAQYVKSCRWKVQKTVYFQYSKNKTKQNRESTEGCSNSIVRKNNDKFGKKDWSQQVEHMQVPNDMGPGVRRSKLSQSVCYTRRKCSMETSYK